MDKHFRRIRRTGATLALWLLISGCRFLQTTKIGQPRTITQAVKLPADMGVQVSPSTAIGEVRNSELRRDGDNYVNEAFGEAAHTLYVDISSSLGAIKLLEQR